MATQRCEVCRGVFDPTKDFYITVNERKGPSVDLCSLTCTIRYLEDDDE